MPSEKGFTLIEVMSAVVILGVSLGLIISLFASGTSSAKSTRDYSRGLFLARALLTERTFFGDEADPDGFFDLANGYEWELSERPFFYPGARSEATGLKRVEVIVRWKDGTRKKEAALYGLVLAGREAKEGSL